MGGVDGRGKAVQNKCRMTKLQFPGCLEEQGTFHLTAKFNLTMRFSYKGLFAKKCLFVFLSTPFL